MNNIAIFASGSGSNAENIIKYFNNHNDINVRLLASNKNDAFALTRANKLGIPTLVFDKNDFYKDKTFLDKLKQYNINTIVLAGFLWLIPEYLIDAYPQRIVNIHPALLPNYGGKGMYGMNVHNVVIENNEKESGITIHTIDKEYDKGTILFQAKCSIEPNDTPERLAKKIHTLEYEFFPPIIEKWLTSSNNQ